MNCMPLKIHNCLSPSRNALNRTMYDCKPTKTGLEEKHKKPFFVPFTNTTRRAGGVMPEFPSRQTLKCFHITVKARPCM